MVEFAQSPFSAAFFAFSASAWISFKPSKSTSDCAPHCRFNYNNNYHRHDYDDDDNNNDNSSSSNNNNNNICIASYAKAS